MCLVKVIVWSVVAVLVIAGVFIAVMAVKENDIREMKDANFVFGRVLEKEVQMEYQDIPVEDFTDEKSPLQGERRTAEIKDERKTV